MSSFKLNWITEQLAVGHAPMSYDELESIREQQITAIVNLCAEYCDLHEIERDYGFEVYYFPVVDDEAPKLEEMEKALEWLDEAIYLGKKVFIHCRMGIGRTGTFITSYLLRRGFGLKLAQKKLKKIRSNPSSFAQWRLLRKYGKQAGKLTIREPSLEGSKLVDLGPYFAEYEALLKEVERAFDVAASVFPDLLSCGRDTDACCGSFLNLQLIEAAYLNYHLNRILTHEERLSAIHRAISAGKGGRAIGEKTGYLCPLSVAGKCIAHPYHPLSCRVYGIPGIHRGETPLGGLQERFEAKPSNPFSLDMANHELYEISRRLFFALNRCFLEGKSLIFPITNVVSGKFVQDYFAILARMDRRPTRS